MMGWRVNRGDKNEGMNPIQNTRKWILSQWAWMFGIMWRILIFCLKFYEYALAIVCIIFYESIL